MVQLAQERLPGFRAPVNYPGNSTKGTIPRRFSYPLDEANVNPQNYLEAASRIEGGDEITSRVWWDK